MTTTLRVLTCNVGSLLEPDWDRRRHEIVSWLDHLDPDVVCLQETWESSDEAGTGHWIADHAERPWHAASGGFAFDPALWPDATLRFGSTVLSRWPIEEHTCHRLPVVEDTDPIPARVPWELLHARTAGLDVFSTHLAAAPTHGLHRRAQVVAIDRIVRTTRRDRDAPPGFGAKRPHMPPILCGDFNAEPDSDEIRFLCSLTPIDGHTTFWQDAWRLVGDGPGYTNDWTLSPIAADMNVHRKRIDYVFVGDPFQRSEGAGRVLDARVVLDRARTGVLGSDHLGVLAEILWPGRPAD